MNTLHKVFQEIQKEPPASLEGEILRLLRREEQARAERRLLLIRLSTAASVGLFLFTAFFALPGLLQSEFWSLFMLLFSDLNIVMSTFGGFLSSLLETLPVLPLSLLLFSAAVLGYSVSQWLSFLEHRDGFRFSHPLFTH